MQTTRLTTRGIARVLARGIKANFNPESQRAEIERLVEYLQDLATSRGMHAELIQSRGERQQAENDADILDAIASELEATLA
jgi:hypothetical protein